MQSGCMHSFHKAVWSHEILSGGRHSFNKDVWRQAFIWQGCLAADVRLRRLSGGRRSFEKAFWRQAFIWQGCLAAWIRLRRLSGGRLSFLTRLSGRNVVIDFCKSSCSNSLQRRATPPPPAILALMNPFPINYANWRTWFSSGRGGGTSEQSYSC